MKFNYKYSQGQKVFMGEKEFTIDRRCGKYDYPAYWVVEDRFNIYPEDVFSDTPVIEANYCKDTLGEATKKISYKHYLNKIDKENISISEYARNLNLLALEGELPPTYGRETEINKIKSILLRRTKPNPLLIGVAGCGKTAIVEELAKTFVQDYLNTENPHTPIIYDLSLNSLLSGTRYRGDFEERLKNILNTLLQQKNIVVFIDEIHSLNYIGNSDGATSAGQILKPALARGDIKCIGATTVEEYEKYIATDKALARRFSNVEIKQLFGKTRTNCINSIIKEYGEYFSINTEEIKANEIEDIIDNIMTETTFPDNVVDIIDNTLAAAKLKGKEKITIKDIKATVMDITGYLVL